MFVLTSRIELLKLFQKYIMAFGQFYLQFIYNNNLQI